MNIGEPKLRNNFWLTTEIFIFLYRSHFSYCSSSFDTLKLLLSISFLHFCINFVHQFSALFLCCSSYRYRSSHYCHINGCRSLSRQLKVKKGLLLSPLRARQRENNKMCIFKKRSKELTSLKEIKRAITYRKQKEENLTI